jgi:DNA recombination protein RmuC
MAEDILRLMGLKENINYLKQKVVEGGTCRPDFTFLLPNNLKLNMDVKFPLENYLKFLNAQSEPEREKFKADFLRDVRKKIKEVSGREYIDKNQSTIDCVLLFIPNEQIYSFIHEQDSSLIDEGIKNKVVFCSPVTLFAVLAVIRQAVDNFSLERTSNRILELLASFRKQWGMFVEKLEKLGDSIEKTHRYYEELVTTRRRQLEKPLVEIDDLHQQALSQESLSQVPVVEGELVKEE